MPATKRTRTAATNGFTEDEKAAMRERARELKARPGQDGETDVLAKIAEMPEADRVKAQRVHAIVEGIGAGLTSRTWYGMPAYAKDGKVVCFFQSAHKFKSRYAMLGFSDKAHLDEGAMWPVYFALDEMTAEVEARITELITRAVG